MNRIQILGHPFDTITLSALSKWVITTCKTTTQRTICFANPEHVLTYLGNKTIRSYTQSCTYSLPDGIGIIWASKLLSKQNKGVFLKDRITGTEFAEKLLATCSEHNLRLTIFGGTQDSSAKANQKILSNYPDLAVQSISGYGKSYTNAIRTMQQFDPDIVMVCLGNPAQEQWIVDNKSKLKAKLVFGNGGAVDFLAGARKRAPAYVHQVGPFGLEWLWRLGQDFTAKRLIRSFKIPVFMWMVMISKISTTTQSEKIAR